MKVSLFFASSIAASLLWLSSARNTQAADFFEPESTAPSLPLYFAQGTPSGEGNGTLPISDEVAPAATGASSCTAAGCKSPGCTSDCAEDCWTDCYRCGPRFYTQAEALFFNRTARLNGVPAVIQVTDENNAFPGTTLLTFGAVGGNIGDPGLRLLVGWYADDCRAWEVSYFGLWDLGGAATVTGANNLAIPGDLGLASLDFFGADTIGLSYNSQLNNAEINHVWLRNNNVSLLAGFRYLSLRDNMNLTATDADTGTSTYNVTTRNNLWGGQLGARYANSWNRWGFDTTAKAALFWNDAAQSQFVQDFPAGFFLRAPVSSNSDQLAFVGDINMSVTYQLWNAWYLRAGYNLIWIEGVAVAPGQFDFTDTPASGTATNFDGLFLQGVNLGVEGRW